MNSFTWLVIKPCGGNWQENPKSAILGTKSSVRSMFLAATSAWTIYKWNVQYPMLFDKYAHLCSFTSEVVKFSFEIWLEMCRVISLFPSAFWSQKTNWNELRLRKRYNCVQIRTCYEFWCRRRNHILLNFNMCVILSKGN